MATIDDLAIEMVNAKEQLKSINTAIWKDRNVLKELDAEIEAKKKEKAEAEKELAQKKDEVASFDVLKEKVEKEYWDLSSNLKAEIKKLSENKKKDEEKYQISIEELSNDVRVLSNRKSELNRDIANLEDDKRKAAIAREEWIAERDLRIKEVQEKLDGFVLAFDQQNAKYNKVNREIEEMEKRAAQKVELDNECDKLERSIDKQNQKMAWLRDEIIGAEDKLEEIRAEIKDLEAQKMELANELADYVKQKLDIKDRKDKLDAKEKYLRKRFEEAWIEF